MEQLQSRPLFKAAIEAIRALVSRQEVPNDRYEAYLSQMLNDMNHDCGNIMPIAVKHQFCKQLLEE
jgi:hypothetical protein